MEKNKYLSRAEKNKLSKEEKAAAALELLKDFDWVEFKKQRGALQHLISLGVLPKKMVSLLEGLQNGCEDIAFFACDYLGQSKKKTLFVSPQFRTIKAERAWHKKNSIEYNETIAKLKNEMLKSLAKA